MPETKSELLEAGCTYRVLCDFATLKAGRTVQLISSSFVFAREDQGYHLVFADHDPVFLNLDNFDKQVIQNISKYLEKCEDVNASQNRADYLKQKRIETEIAQTENEALDELTKEAIKEEIVKNGLSPKEAYLKVRKILRHYLL